MAQIPASVPMSKMIMNNTAQMIEGKLRMAASKMRAGMANSIGERLLAARTDNGRATTNPIMVATKAILIVSTIPSQATEHVNANLASHTGYD